MKTVLAVDLGGTKSSFALVDERGTIREREKVAAAASPDQAAAQIAERLGRADAVGLIVPGIYTPATGTAWCPNLWGRAEVPLLQHVSDRVAAPVAIDSDRAGYVLGEAWLGAARGLRDVVFAAIGTGIGIGIMSDGRVLRGAHGIAGAAGWFALDPGWNDRYAEVGCWEAEAAGPAIASAFGAEDAAAVATAARRGDEAARLVLERAARYTGMGIANLISLLNPEAVVLGGGVFQGAGDLLLEPVRREVRRWAQPVALARCRVELTRLAEDAGLFGAARLALDLS